MSRHTGRAAAWAAARITDCIPEAVCGRADPDRGGRHQHSLRDLDGCAAGDGSGGPRAAAPLIEAPRPPLCAPAGGQRLAPPRGAGRHEGELPPLAADGDAGLVVDVLTGIAVLAGDGAGPRTEEVRVIQSLAGGVRPGDCDLAGALVRRAGQAADDATLASVGAALWEIAACGDMGETITHSQAGRRAHGAACPRPLGLAPRALAAACRALVAEVAERAGTAAAALLRPAALEAAVLGEVRRDPGPGERRIALAVGSTQGRVHTVLARHDLVSAVRRRAWVAAGGVAPAPRATGAKEVAVTAARLAADEAGLAPLYRYHVAAAVHRLSADDGGRAGAAPPPPAERLAPTA